MRPVDCKAAAAGFVLEYRVMMDAAPPSAPRIPRVRNPRTQALIRRDSLWQIFLPVALALVGVVVLGVLVVAPVGAGTRSAWADVSLIFLLIPTMMLFGLIVLALLAGLVVAVYYGLRELPFVARLGQEYVALAAVWVKTGAGKASDVVLSIRSFTAGVRRAAKDVRNLFG
jgi:hypothetical protein